MRYLVLIAVLVALPLNASAQQRRSAERRADQNRSEQRQSNDRQSGERRSDDRRSDDRRSDGRGSNERRSAEQKPANAAQLPWWERQQTPWWEQKQMPAWELNRIPGYAQGNVARAMLDQQRHQAPVTNHRRQRYYQPSVVYVLPYRYFPESIVTTAPYSVPPPAPAVTVHADPEPPLPAMGALRLEVEPKESLQIYVDGVYVGTPADLGDELELTPGTRRIELRASGYRSLAFSAEIVDGRSITYRGSLERVPDSAARRAPVAPGAPVAPAAPAAPAAPVAPATMYVIPGCYLGNVSPKNVALPAGCDLSKLTTITP